MKKIRKIYVLLLLLVTIFPSIVFAYSNKVILGGDSIGIKVNSKYVMIVGFYKVNGKFIASDAGLKVGDSIVAINDISITNIDDMVDILNKNTDNENKFTILRNDKKIDYYLKLIKDDNDIYKTGIYVKDSINGIGSLTYIDPDTKIFGALGHDIISKYTFKKVDVNDGKIFNSTIVGINKGSKGKTGSKEAKLYTDQIFGNITKNEITGIYGNYHDDFDSKKLIDIANLDEIELGKATIRTVIAGNEIGDYEIEIINIDKKSETKNILFKVIDSKLLDKTGGIVAGMSGSPIIQNNKLIGAVTHVVVDDPTKGFGISIITMLEDGEKE